MQIGIPAGAVILNSLAAELVTFPAMLMLLLNVGADENVTTPLSVGVPDMVPLNVPPDRVPVNVPVDNWTVPVLLGNV